MDRCYIRAKKYSNTRKNGKMGKGVRLISLTSPKRSAIYAKVSSTRVMKCEPFLVSTPFIQSHVSTSGCAPLTNVLCVRAKYSFWVCAWMWRTAGISQSTSQTMGSWCRPVHIELSAVPFQRRRPSAGCPRPERAACAAARLVYQQPAAAAGGQPQPQPPPTHHPPPASPQAQAQAHDVWRIA